MPSPAAVEILPAPPPSRPDFHRRFVQPRLPVVVEGSAVGWTAMRAGGPCCWGGARLESLAVTAPDGLLELEVAAGAPGREAEGGGAAGRPVFYGDGRYTEPVRAP